MALSVDQNHHNDKIMCKFNTITLITIRIINLFRVTLS